VVKKHFRFFINRFQDAAWCRGALKHGLRLYFRGAQLPRDTWRVYRGMVHRQCCAFCRSAWRWPRAEVQLRREIFWVPASAKIELKSFDGARFGICQVDLFGFAQLVQFFGVLRNADSCPERRYALTLGSTLLPEFSPLWWPGPSPGCSSRGGHKTEGGATFLK